jgi:hypothetical protein
VLSLAVCSKLSATAASSVHLLLELGNGMGRVGFVNLSMCSCCVQAVPTRGGCAAVSTAAAWYLVLYCCKQTVWGLGSRGTDNITLR